MKILVLLSGGIDSAVVLAGCITEHNCVAIGYDYGQPHRIELDRAASIARYYSVPFTVKTLPPIPVINDVVFAGRNLILIAHAIAQAQADLCDAVAIGCNASDWARFPDCRPAFRSEIKDAAETYNVRVLTPLLHYDKRTVVEMARERKVPIDLTWSCYSPQNGEPCGKCLACITRKEAIECCLSPSI